jgi:tyrosyl-tRNA synthetase
MLDKETIDTLIGEHEATPHERKLQRRLAYEVTKLVHGEDVLASVVRATDMLFSWTGEEMFGDVAALEILEKEIPVAGSNTIINILVLTGLSGSNGEARRLIDGGAISVNGVKINEDQDVSSPSLIKKGKNSFVLVR